MPPPLCNVYLATAFACALGWRRHEATSPYDLYKTCKQIQLASCGSVSFLTSGVFRKQCSVQLGRGGTKCQCKCTYANKPKLRRRAAYLDCGRKACIARPRLHCATQARHDLRCRLRAWCLRAGCSRCATLDQPTLCDDGTDGATFDHATGIGPTYWPQCLAHAKRSALMRHTTGTGIA